jgi:purine-cytosine permease-like protein
MSKSIVTVAAVGFLGFALWKILSILLLPLVGTLLGFLLTIVKVAVIAGLILLAWWLVVRRRKDEGEA